MRAGHEHDPDPSRFAEVEYAFKNRTPHMKFTREAFSWLQEQVESMIYSTTLGFISHELEMAN
jgi:hypothetical protein